MCNKFRRNARCLYVTGVPRVDIAQPPITRVSKLVRDEALSIWYGKHTYYFALRDDGRIITRWRKIGPRSASMLRKMVIVYSRKEAAKCYLKTLREQMAGLGVKVDEAVTLVRTKYPYCTCSNCVTRTVEEVLAEAVD
jgi:hypothetical protein